jgi:hypothetical protein
MFLPIIFLKSAGLFLFVAAFFSASLAFTYRSELAEHLRLDLICLGTIAAIMALDMLFVFGFHLTVPYVSAIKYSYLALPFFCLLAASVADKGWALIRTMDWKNKIHMIKPLLVVIGLVLVFASLVESVLFLNAWVGFVAFGVDSVTYYGFNLYSDTLPKDAAAQWHFAGLILVFAALAVPFMVSLLRKSVQEKRCCPVNSNLQVSVAAASSTAKKRLLKPQAARLTT